jgi:hypothetical protein
LALKDIRKPTFHDYIDIPKEYVHGRPMLNYRDLEKGPRPIKRFHDWYMRAANAGLESFRVSIPPSVFATGNEKSAAYVNFEDMHLLLNYKRLDVQLITVFSL